MARPVLIFDGDCGFCRRWIASWKELTGSRVEYLASRDAAARFPEIPARALERAIHLIEPDGARFSGAHAVFRALGTAPGQGHWRRLYESLPGFAPVSEAAYRLVANHRTTFSWLTWIFHGESPEPVRYSLTRWLFLRALGVVYLVALLSLWVQLPGLVGEQGILPSPLGLAALRWICGGGIAAAGLLILGAAQLPCLVCLWGAYWLLARECGEFLWFQWDGLMLEMGLLAIFVAPLTLLPRPWTRAFEETRPSTLVIWLLRWLLFRVMFYSGLVKLASGDPHWRDLTALGYHFETQPLPTWAGWWMHQLPGWALRACAAAMFGAELALPWLALLPRRARLLAFAPLVAFQLLIDFTGNYGFFGWQVCALCLLLLDDSAIEAALRRLLRKLSARSARPARPEPWPKRALNVALAATVLAATLLDARSVQERVAPLRSFNGYGVFAVMTTERDEIQLEGSRDGKEWLPYGFKWKPGDLSRAPSFVEPHMPRLDWQMWFAALGTVRQNPWFLNLMIRVLQGSPPVLSLLGENPFPDAPPKYLRAALFQYHFMDFHERAVTGRWWRIESKGFYVPRLSLDMLK